MGQNECENAMSQVALHISPSAIRMLEGTMQKDRLVTGGHAIIENASIYFENGKLTHLREMAKAIVDTLQANDIHTKNLSICYDHDLTVEILDTPVYSQQGKIPFFKKDMGKKNKEVSSLPNGVLEKSQEWGESVNFRNDQEIRTVTSSVTRMDRDLSQSICYEFAELGYTVTSIEAPQSVLMYMRHANPYSYDSLAMLVLYVNNPNDMAWVYTFMKGVPRNAIKKYLAGAANWSLSDRIVETCQKEAAGNQLRRPTVILAGDAFADSKIYKEVVDALEQEGFGVYDIYDNINDLPNGESSVDMENALRIEVPEDADFMNKNDEVCGRYSICMALLLRMLDKKPDNLIDPKDKPSTKRSALAMTKSALVIGMVLFALSVSALIFETISWQVASRDLQPQSQIEAQLEEAKKANERSTQHMQAYNVHDGRYLELIKFIQEHINSENINVASVDTDDMFETLSANDSQYASENIADGEAENADNADSDKSSEASRKTVASINAKTPIIIRGYAKDSESIRKFYTLLSDKSNSDGSTLGKPRLVGIQCVELPKAVSDTVQTQQESSANSAKPAADANSDNNNTAKNNDYEEFYKFMNTLGSVLESYVSTVDENGTNDTKNVIVSIPNETIFCFEIELT